MFHQLRKSFAVTYLLVLCQWLLPFSSIGICKCYGCPSSVHTQIADSLKAGFGTRFNRETADASKTPPHGDSESAKPSCCKRHTSKNESAAAGKCCTRPAKSTKSPSANRSCCKSGETQFANIDCNTQVSDVTENTVDGCCNAFSSSCCQGNSEVDLALSEADSRHAPSYVPQLHSLEYYRLPVADALTASFTDTILVPESSLVRRSKLCVWNN